LTGLILDGAVDLTRSANAFWADAARSFDSVLTRTLEACSSNAGCAREVADPAGMYDAVLARFSSPRGIDYADQDGVVRQHQVTSAAIEVVIDTLLYDPAGRELIQRAVAASARGDDVPFARLMDLLGSGNGPGISSFAYHAVLCADYRVSPTSNASDVAALLAYARQEGISTLRTDEVFTSQFPCLYWPYQPPTGTRPEPLTTTPYPVFVLAATGDPITPVDQARDIASRLIDGYLVVTQGGPHVTFGRADGCVDAPIVAFLLDGRRPADRSISCPGHIAAEYVPLTADRRSGYADALEAMIAARTELFADPQFAFWDRARDLQVGCRNGGFFVVTPGTTREYLRFAGCAFAKELPLTGVGTYDLDSHDLSWSVTFPDGKLEYLDNATERRATGTYQGKPVDISN
jgi:pimeloyl-ACP methyl ester carboxylesterase